MAYYDKLVTAWNTSSSGVGFPAGTTGASLQGQSTNQKLININAWITTGSVPTTINVPTDQIANCISFAEFKVLTAAKQTNIMTLLGVPGTLLGGSSHLDSLLVGMLLDSFAVNSVTIANLTALSAALTQPWWQFAGYPRAFDMGDVSAAGLS